MPFDAVHPTDYSLMSAAAILFAFLCLGLFYLIDRKTPVGEEKNRITFLLFIIFIGYILLSIISLPLDKVEGQIAQKASFWLFYSIALVTFLLYRSGTKVDINRTKEMIIPAAAIVLLGTIFFREKISSYLVFLIFIPAWFAVIFFSYNLFKRSVNLARRKTYFYAMVSIILSGAGLLIDSYLVNSVQRIPILSLMGPFWGVVALYAALADKNEEIEPESWIDFVAIPFLIIIFLAIFRASEAIAVIRQRPLFFTRNKLFLSGCFAVLGGALYFNARPVLIDVVKLAGKKMVDPLTRALSGSSGEILRKFEPGRVNEFVNKYSECSAAFMIRSRNSNRAKLVCSSQLPLLEEGDEIILVSEIARRLWAKRYVHICALNVQEVALGQEIFEKIVPAAEKRDFLIAGSQKPDYPFLPPAVLMVIGEPDHSISPGEIRNFKKISDIYHKTILKIQLENCPVMEEIPESISCADNIDQLVEILRKSPPMWGTEHNASLFLKMEGKDWQAYPLKGELPGWFEPDKFSPGEKSDECGLFSVNVGDKNVGKTRLLKIQAGPTRALLLFVFPGNDFVYEPPDPVRVEKISYQLGFALERIITTLSFRRQLEKIKIRARDIHKHFEDRAKRAAESIHDEVVQEIYAAGVQVQLIEKKLAAESPRSREDLDLLKNTVSESLKKARRIMEKLRNSQSIQDENTLENIRKLIGRLQAEAGISIKCIKLETLSDLPPRISRVIGRVLREGLNNVRKHSGAQNVWLRIRKVERGVSLLLIDDGKGFDKKVVLEKSSGFGLESIGDLCQENGCRFHVHARANKGTRLRVFCPFS